MATVHHSQVEQRVRAMQQEAYIRLLRVVCAQPFDWETEALLTSTRKLLKITNDEHSTYMKECRPGGRYCLTQPQSEQMGMGQFRASQMQPVRAAQQRMPMMPQQDYVDPIQGFGGTQHVGARGGPANAGVDKVWR